MYTKKKMRKYQREWVRNLPKDKKKERTERATKHKHVNKKFGVWLLGGQCCICGYDRCMAALDFHHLDPSQKERVISQTTSYKRDRFIKCLSGCIVVCATCHKEIHAGYYVT